MPSGFGGGEGRGGERGETWDISEMVRRPDGVIEMMSGSFYVLYYSRRAIFRPSGA